MSKLILFNKPFQVLSQFSEIDQKTTLKNFLDHPDAAQCYPAGRLDYDSEGLLLLTNDGKLQHLIADPKHKLPKSYWVQVEGLPSDEDLAPLRKGVLLKDGPCKPAQVKIIPSPAIWDRHPPIRKRLNDQTTWLNIVISEGRNRQVRRMCGAINFPCLRLVRHRIGNWSINGLEPGHYKIDQVHLPASTEDKAKQVNSGRRNTSSSKTRPSKNHQSKSSKQQVAKSRSNYTSRKPK